MYNTIPSNQTIHVLMSLDEQVIFAASDYQLLVKKMREHVFQQLDISPCNIPSDVSLTEKHNIGNDIYEFDYLRRSETFNVSVTYAYKILPIVYYFEPQKLNIFRTTITS